MPQMKPNSAIVVAVVTQTETYSRQDDFNVLSLDVKTASPKAEAAFLFDMKKDALIKALISKEEYKAAHIKEESTITVEIKKVSVTLWRVIKLI